MKSAKCRIARCSKKDCHWRLKVNGDKFAVERAKADHYDLCHGEKTP